MVEPGPLLALIRILRNCHVEHLRSRRAELEQLDRFYREGGLRAMASPHVHYDEPTVLIPAARIKWNGSISSSNFMAIRGSTNHWSDHGGKDEVRRTLLEPAGLDPVHDPRWRPIGSDQFPKTGADLFADMPG